MELKRVVVTGLGAVTPLGNCWQSTWEAMLQGKSGADEITLFDPTLFKTRFACEVKGLDISHILDKKEERKMDRYAQFAIASAYEAIEQAHLNFELLDANRIGVVWASGMGGLKSFESDCMAYSVGQVPRFSPLLIPKTILNMGAGHISLHFGLKGPNFGVASACASSGHAIAQAYDLIRLGRADIMLTGGSDADITCSGVGGFNSLHALSTRNDNPQTASRPFSASRDGFVIGEGGACLVLEEYEHAKARGASIFAEVVGVGMNADAYHMTAPEPNGAGAAHVMELALQDASITPSQVDYINAHGTSTPLGDIAEVKAIRTVWGEDAQRLNISSTKSMTGHLMGATGAVEAAATIMALKEGVIPPTINHAEGDDDETIGNDLNFTFNLAQKKDLTYAISNTFGFGGHNACIVFKKW